MSEPFSVNRLTRFTQETSVQNVSTALDDVAQGIAASPQGISGIQDMIEAFAPLAQSLPDELTGLSVVQNFAEVAAPGDYFTSLQADSIYKEAALVPFDQLARTLNDSEFDAGKGLLAANQNLFGGEGIAQNLGGKNGLLGSSLAGIRFGYLEQADVGTQRVGPGVDSPPSALGSMPIFDKLTTTADGSVAPGIEDKAIIIVGGKPEEAIGDKAVIVVGGKPEEAIGDKAVIVVGGKEQEGTAYQPTTFESSLRSLFDVNPFTDEGRQALSDFGTQLLALGNLESTVKTSADLFKQLSDSTGQTILE